MGKWVDDRRRGSGDHDGADRPSAHWLVVLERVLMMALASVLILALGSALVTGRVVAPGIAATHAVNRFESHLLESHLAFAAAGSQSARSVIGPLDAAARVCLEGLAGVALSEPLARAHPCESLPVLLVAASAALQDGGEVGSAGHAEYDAAFKRVIADAEALDASVGEALSDAQRWVRGVQMVTTALLAALVVLIWVTARAHRRATARLSAALRREATHDALTGAFNRLELRRVLERASAEHRAVAVLFLDLDEFKTVNDANGHATGDALLVAVAERLRRLTRPDDTVVRLGGDEFAVVCLDADEDDALALADHVVAGLRQPLLVNGRALAVSASVGVTSDSGQRRDVVELNRQADIAMYVAKAYGGDRAEVYRPQMHAEIVERMQLGEDLASAVNAGEITVVYQPLVDIASGRVRRVEALARWTHPTRGAVTPDVFIAVAERRGLIGAMGAQVLGRACQDLRAWHRQHPEARGVGVAVNVATSQLLADDFVDVVRSALASTGLAGEHLTLEITEGALAAGHAQAEYVLAELRSLGVRVAIDDFGTGHSSLARLRDLLVDELKIDRSFVTPIGEDRSAEPLVVSILALARSLHLEVVAEGVETFAQLAFLGDHGCDLAQGCLLSKPRTAEDCAELWSDGVTPTRSHDVPVTSGAARGHDVVAALSGPLQAPEVLTRAALRGLLAKLATMIGLDTAYLTRIDWQRGVQHIDVAHHVAEPLVAEGLAVPWRDTVCRLMLTTGPAATDDVPAAFPDSPAGRDLRLQTYVGVPIVDTDGQLYGTLCAASRERRPVSDDTLRLMEVFAALLSHRLTAQGVTGTATAEHDLPNDGASPTAAIQGHSALGGGAHTGPRRLTDAPQP